MHTTYNEIQLKEIIKNSYSIAGVLRALHLDPTGGNYKTIKSKIRLWNIDYSHFTGQGHLRGKTNNWAPKIPLKEILVENSSYGSSGLKKRLLKEGLLVYECAFCKNNGNWMGKKLALELDHISGNSFDNRIENLRLLCPNCHSQTPTFACRGMYPETRRAKRNEIIQKQNKIRKQRIKKMRPKSFCPICTRVMVYGRKYCSYKCSHLASRKFQRPSKEDLAKMIWIMPAVQIAKKLGIKHSTLITKWCKQYNISTPCPGYWTRRAHGYSHDEALTPRIHIQKNHILTREEIISIRNLLQQNMGVCEIARRLQLKNHH